MASYSMAANRTYFKILMVGNLLASFFYSSFKLYLNICINIKFTI